VVPIDGEKPPLLFTENDTNMQRIFNTDNPSPFVKDAFHQYVINKISTAINPQSVGTKAAIHYQWDIPAGEQIVIELRLHPRKHPQNHLNQPQQSDFHEVFDQRKTEAEAFYVKVIDQSMDAQSQHVSRQGYAGLLWAKQFYHYAVKDWLAGDPNMPAPPDARKSGRNQDWHLLYNRDILSMPDKWEYPWPAAWDTAFHMIPFAKVDPAFAKDQLRLFLREWYMHPNGQIPAYEFALGDVNPPVHAWACWRVYKMTGPRGKRDKVFLARCFQKLLLNFTWWVNRKDVEGNNIFSGGFLGLDNIGVFDHSQPLPTNGSLEQADGTAWMAFYCNTMLSIALELARDGD